MTHLLTIEELKSQGRPLGQIAEEKLDAFITEAEQLHVKPILGDELFLMLLDEVERKKEEDMSRDISLLLNGGRYEYKKAGCQGNSVKAFMGLKTAIAYYVYAQNLMVGDVESTRFGNVFKNGDFSTRLSSKERSDAYNNAVEIADSYMKECVEFCKCKSLIKSVGTSKVSLGGMTIRKIG